MVSGTANAVNPIRVAGALLPTGAVLFGLHGLHHAWVAILVYHLGIVAFALLLRGRRLTTRNPGGASDLRLEPSRAVLVGFAVLCALTGAVLYILWDAMVSPGQSLVRWLAQQGLWGPGWWLFVPYFALVHPVLEEWHWSRIEEGTPLRVGILDLLFGAYHVLVLASLVRWPWLVLLFAVLTAVRVQWRSWYRSRRTRWLPLLTHGLADLSVIVAAMRLVGEGR